MNPVLATSSRSFTAFGRDEASRAQGDFAGLLARSGPSEAEQTPARKARTAAEDLVSIALVQPILKQLRETSQAAPPFAPTQAEKQFQGLHDAALAQRLVRASNFPLVDRLEYELSRRGTEASA